MAEEGCTLTDWNNDKSDEIFFSLLGELLQNNTRATELYTLLSSQANNKSQFQNDNEYRCKEDVVDEDHEESDLNKLVDILKNRLQNGKSVPAGLTQEKLTRLKDDFLKQKEENKRTEQNHNTPTKKNKNAPPVLVAKPKPKNKKQLQAEQRRRELEMASIAKEIDEKRKKNEEKELFRKKQEKERKRVLEEDLKRQEEDKKRLLNETKKKREKEEKEKEHRNQKEKERQEKIKKMQEEEQRRKEEEKRRKAEEKTAKAKALKEGKEREEREKLEKQQLSQKGQGKARSQQYQQYQQQQQKYPREVPPRFLRQQQIKQQGQLKDSEFNVSDSQFRDNSNWTEVVADTTYDSNNHEEWEPDLEENSTNNVNGQSEQNNSSWGGVPVSEDWDLDTNKPTTTRSSVNLITESRLFENSSLNNFSDITTNGKVGKALFAQVESPAVTNDRPQVSNNNDSCWGASLTGSTWDTSNNTKQWDESVQSDNSIECNSPSNVSKNIQSNGNSSWCKYSNKPVSIDSNKSDSPGITPWAGLDSFEGIPVTQETTNHIQNSTANNVFAGGAKPKTVTALSSSFTNNVSEPSDKIKPLPHTRLKEPELTVEQSDSNVVVSSIDNKIDTNLKVTGWLESSTPSEDWDEDDKETNDEDFGWTTVQQNKAKKTVTTSSNPSSSVPGTPSKSENNAWTNRALKQLLDMGFKKEHAEKALRDNNGIIESAVSDLLMKGEMTESSSSSTQQIASKPDTSNTPICNGLVSQSSTPQKLNRKQRRKLQQMQNAEQQKDISNVIKDTSQVSSISSSDTPTVLNTSPTVTMPKSKNDGLLPTPPPSLRLVPTDEPVLEKTIARPQPSKPQGTELNNSLLKTSVCLTPIGQQTITKVESEQNTPPCAPIGSSRPSIPTPIQPPNSQTKQPPNLNNSSSEVSEELNNSTPLQPPVNPVLLAQMHLQKLGLENTPPASSYSPSSVPSPASSQTVTNSMIQQYLQQIAQSSEVEQTSTVSSSPINTPLHSSTMHLSGLLQQAPVPASSLSEGPQKSKLLQWTQPCSASNSEPNTPPTAVDFSDEPPKEKSPVNKVDPVSAKWGVVGVPKLLPTPAEFKPGVPWKSQQTTESKPDSNSNEEEDFEEEESGGESDPEVASVSEEPPPPIKSIKSASPEAIHPLKNIESQPKEIVTLPPPLPVPQPQPQPQPLVQPQAQSQPVMPMKHPEQPTIRPPPGLGGAAANSFNCMKNRVEEMNWLTICGLSSVFDPTAMRSLCQQFGTLLDFRIIGNAIYVRYETHAHAHSAHLSLNGKLIYNSQILAEVSTEFECMKAIENSSTMLNNSVGAVPLTNHVTQPIAQGFPNISQSFGGLWASSAQVAQPSVPQSFVQQSYTPSYAGPSSINMNGGFAHWGLPSATTVIPNSNQLWQAAPQQPTNVFPTYPGWLTKPADVPVHASIFSPGMDRCLPSELFNAKEHGS